MKEIIDIHHLVGEDYWLSINKKELAYKNNIDCIMKNNIKAFIYPFPSSKSQLYLEENNMVNEYALKNENDIVPVFALNTNLEESYNSIEKYIKNFKFFGIIIWPILCNIDLTELENDIRFKKFCEKYNFFIYIHVGAGNEEEIKRVKKVGKYTPQDAIKFAKFFKNKKIILGHMLRLSYDSLIETKNLENVVIDTSGISSQKRWYENNCNVFPSYDAKCLKDMNDTEVLEYCVNVMGLQNKLVFGSSYPYSLWWKFDLQDEIKLIEELKIDEEDKEKILSKNIKKFLEF